MKIFRKKVDFFENIGYNKGIIFYIALYCVEYKSRSGVKCQIKSQFMM
jgi:hypothetical protein